jgi:hypothetical protein
MGTNLTRRDFLRLAGLGLASLAFRPIFRYGEELDGSHLLRVAIQSVSIRKEPNDQSPILFQRFRDEILTAYEEVTPKTGPAYNPLWYRVWGGYVHSGYLEPVEARLNPIIETFPPKGQIAELTVPFSQAMRYDKRVGWYPVYRLYYQSVHWVTGVDTGPDGQPWYRLLDELLKIDYFVPAEHLRPIYPQELTPIRPEVPLDKKRIDVSLAQQRLIAYENEKVVLDTKVSTGIPDERVQSADYIPTGTPRGVFRVRAKIPSKHMGDGNLTADPDAYELPGVPWVSFFLPGIGVGFHGTYWHQNYGLPMSHGCVNMRTDEAKWLFRWASPPADGTNNVQTGYGTLVNVF